MLRSTAQSLGRGFNAQGVWAYAFHRNAVTMHRRVVPNPRGLVGRTQAQRAQIEATLAAARTKDGQQPKENLSAGFSSRITKLEDKLEKAEAQRAEQALFGRWPLSTFEQAFFGRWPLSTFFGLMAANFVGSFLGHEAANKREREREKREAVI
jgi:hypothetical protein